MSLLSLEFFIFFLISVTIYYSVPSSFQKKWLLICNLIFCASYGIRNLIFLLFCILNTFFGGRLIEKEKENQKRKKVYDIVVTVNSFVLLFLLLNNTFSDALKRVSGVDIFRILMPLGFAYYCLEAIAYVTDIYHKRIAAENDLLRYSLFVSFFPKIVQGPITRYEYLREQLSIAHLFSYCEFAHGAQLALWGIFKKLVIADRLNIAVTEIFKNASSGSIVLYGAILFSIQLYADFSGCMDLIGGCSEMLGIHLPANFNRPYAACSVKDFWRRWHISLGSWLRDYIYIPLGGSRRGTAKKYLNLMITFIASGVWHGASPGYLAWGILHGAYQILEDFFRPISEKWLKKRNIRVESFGIQLLQRVKTFLLVSIAWIFFRGNGFMASIRSYGLIFTKFQFSSLIRNIYSFGIGETYSWFLVIAVSLMFLLENIRSKRNLRGIIDQLPLILRWSIYLAGIAIVVLTGNYGINGTGMFLYAQY